MQDADRFYVFRQPPQTVCCIRPPLCTSSSSSHPPSPSTSSVRYRSWAGDNSKYFKTHSPHFYCWHLARVITLIITQQINTLLPAIHLINLSWFIRSFFQWIAIATTTTTTTTYPGEGLSYVPLLVNDILLRGSLGQ